MSLDLIGPATGAAFGAAAVLLLLVLPPRRRRGEPVRRLVLVAIALILLGVGIVAVSAVVSRVPG